MALPNCSTRTPRYFFNPPKSKGFINGVLDKLFIELQASGEIKKIGRLCYAAGFETKDLKRIGLSHEVTLSFKIPSKNEPDIQILNMRFR